ncbi:MAG: hydrogenase maturation protease [Actinobacteria bacterium]|nr:hydrogenase maturation protease [Actinomycetota bacterium]
MSGGIFVGGVGNPWLGDLDFGPQFVRRYAHLDWPEHVTVTDAAEAAHRVLHQLQAAEPDRVIFVAAYPRGDEPGTIRRYRAEDEEPDEEELQARLGESAGGVIDFAATLDVARYYGALPTDTIVIEVEAVDETFGTEFSPSVEASFERVLEMVREEIARPLDPQPEPTPERQQP